MAYTICSECFYDEGLKRTAFSSGRKNGRKCKNCGAKNGAKFDKNSIPFLIEDYFVHGSMRRFDFGGFPEIQANVVHKKTSIKVKGALEKDLDLLEKHSNLKLFRYSPRMWMLGDIEPLISLQSKDSAGIISEIFARYPVKELNENDHFFRLRKNPEFPNSKLQYDTAPKKYLGDGRFDLKKFPAMYASQDLDLCIHECRTTAEDDLYVAKLRPLKRLKLLDLTEILDDEFNEFESLDLAIHYLFLAGKHSYFITRKIADKAKEEGFDGIIYPSYFSYLKNGHRPFRTLLGISIRQISVMKEFAKSELIPNIVLFGRPVRDKKVEVENINRIIVNQVEYKITFGPGYYH